MVRQIFRRFHLWAHLADIFVCLPTCLMGRRAEGPLGWNLTVGRCPLSMHLIAGHRPSVNAPDGRSLSRCLPPFISVPSLHPRVCWWICRHLCWQMATAHRPPVLRTSIGAHLPPPRHSCTGVSWRRRADRGSVDRRPARRSLIISAPARGPQRGPLGGDEPSHAPRQTRQTCSFSAMNGAQMESEPKLGWSSAGIHWVTDCKGEIAKNIRVHCAVWCLGGTPITPNYLMI